MNRISDTAWLSRHRLRADVNPSSYRASLTIDGKTCGSLEPSLARQMVDAGLPLHARDAAWAIDGLPNESFALIAQWLHRHGHGGKWRNELIAVTSDAGEVLAAIERAAVRPLGIATRAVHLVGTTASGKVWVQRRALDKAVDPVMLDTLVGGLAAFGESTQKTLERETWEEAGLQLAELGGLRDLGRLIVRRPLPDGYMVEHIEMFTAELPDGVSPQNQDGEVMGFECLSVDDLIEKTRDDFFTFEATLIHAHWWEQAA
jgi:8-oxo-dGTP pyrophosphatase MutT (NUDIX family)